MKVSHSVTETTYDDVSFRGKKTHDSAIIFLFVKYRTVDAYYVDKSNSLHCVRFNSGYASNNDQPANVLNHVSNFFPQPDSALEHYFFIDV
jgi:hypothetical protein